MEKINIVIFLVGIGFLLIGLVYFKSKSIKNSIESMNTYKDANKFVNINGSINFIAGILIIILNVLDIILKTSYELYLILPIVILSTLVTSLLNKNLKS